MKPFTPHKCPCGRGLTWWLCKRIGEPDRWLCETCHTAWAAKLDADLGARV